MSMVINVSNVSAADDWNVARYGDVKDIGTRLRALEKKDEEYRAQIDSRIKEYVATINFNDDVVTNEDTGDENYTFNGGTKYILALDEINGYYVKKSYTMRSIGKKMLKYG